MSTNLAQLAADRYEIADVLHRFAFGLDHGDADSLASTLTEDCLFDFRPAGKKLGTIAFVWWGVRAWVVRLRVQPVRSFE